MPNRFSDNWLLDGPTKKLPKIAHAWKEGGPPDKGAGWWGRGALIRVQQSYRARDSVDGAGLCSPGRWPSARRRLPDSGSFGEGLV